MLVHVDLIYESQLCQVKVSCVCVRLDQVEGYVKLGQIILSYISGVGLGQIILNYDMLGYIELSQIMLGYIELSQIRL